MPTEFYYPLSSAPASIPAGHDDYPLSAGSNKNAACRPGGGRTGPMTHDDDTTILIVSINGTLKEQAFNPDWPAGPIASITALTLAERSKHNVAASILRSCRFVNAAGTAGATVVSQTGTLNTYTETAMTDAMSARPGGGPWTPADIADSVTMFMEVFNSAGVGSESIFQTSIWGQITYSPPTGGLVFLLASVVLGTLVDFSQFQRYLAWRRAFHPRHTILSGEEVRRAWRELREYRHPRFFLPAV